MHLYRLALLWVSQWDELSPSRLGGNMPLVLLQYPYLKDLEKVPKINLEVA